MTTLTLPGVTVTHDPSPAEIAEKFVRRLHTQVDFETDEKGTRLTMVAHWSAAVKVAIWELDPLGVTWGDVTP